MNTIAVKIIEQKITELEQARDRFVNQANARAGAFNFAIEQLRELLGGEPTAIKGGDEEPEDQDET